jgi:RHH-type rel operon transcriptional repressor/antitoxin RelB
MAKALEELAKATDRPKTYFIEKALESYLAECADYQVALDRFGDKDDRIISTAELRRRIGRRPPLRRARALQALRGIRRQSNERGLDKLNMKQIDALVAKSRKERRRRLDR